MKLVFIILICLFTISCNTHQVDASLKSKVYSDSSSLFYKGAPLFIFNENIDRLTARPSFYQDTTNSQGTGYSYLTIDTFFTARQSTGTLIGNLYIETDSLRQVQRVRGYWAISVQMNDKTKQEAIDTIKKRFFPNMAQNFLLKEIDTIRHKNFIEEFKFYPSPDSGDVDHGYVPHWSFYYDAKHIKKSL